MNKTVLITGATRGIGFEMAKHFASKGYNIIVDYFHNRVRADRAYKELLSLTTEDKLLICKANVASREEVCHLFDVAIKRFGSVDILINNAGLNIDKPFLDLEDSDWDMVINTNLRGPFIVSQEFAKRYNGSDGHIINFASGTSIKGRKNGANYCSSKAGVITLTKCMALELAPKIRVNTIILGYVNTHEVVERYHLDDEEKYEELISKIPLGKIAPPKDVVNMVDFIVSSDIYATGQKFIINGGSFMP